MSKIKITIVCLIVICTAANVMAGCYNIIIKTCGCGATKPSMSSVACSNKEHINNPTIHGTIREGSFTCRTCKQRATFKKIDKAIKEITQWL